MKNVTVSNLVYNGEKKAVRIDGYLQDSAITNVVATRTKLPVVSVLRENGLQNVKISNIVAPEGGEEIGKA